MAYKKPAVTEREFTRWVIDVAQTGGWLVHHDLPAQKASGRWATWIDGNAGFPDLVLAHPHLGQVLFVELKVGKNQLTTGQDTWLMTLGLANVENHVWRYETDRDAIVSRLLGHTITT
jgi:hypothetical protein